jgi:2-isopropylmalate synthase
VKTIEIFDTTLRDGEQAPGNSMTPEKRIELFQAIDATGAGYVEAGFPAASQQDFETVSQIIRLPRDCVVTVFARATPADIDLALKAIDGAPRTQLQLLLTGSELHAEHKRRQSPQDLAAEITRAVSYAKSQGVSDISLGYEDASRGGADFLHRMVDAGVAAGGTTVVLADTVGQATPEHIGGLVRSVRSWSGPDVKISLHCHNDLGLSLANALAGIGAGADVVQATLCGIGERTGNTPFEELATVLHYKAADYGARCGVDLLKTVHACGLVMQTLDLAPWKHKPILGRYAFSTAAGVHASGLANAPVTYEYVEPALFGRRREVVLNRASGRANLRVRLAEMGLDCPEDKLEEMYHSFISDPEPHRFNDAAMLRGLYTSVL